VDEIAREYEVNAFPSRRFSSITKLHEAALILKDMIIVLCRKSYT